MATEKEQRIAEVIEIENLTVDKLLNKAIVLRDEITEEGEETPFITVNKEDDLLTYIEEGKYPKTADGNTLLTINDIILMCEYGIGIKVPAKSLKDIEICFRPTEIHGLYRLSYTSDGKKTTKNIMYNSVQITIETDMRTRLLLRILRKILTQEEEKHYKSMEEELNGIGEEK